MGSNIQQVVGNDERGFPSIVRRPMTEADWLAVVRGDRRMDEYEDILDERLAVLKAEVSR